jgi:hypothetical protein
MMILIQGKYFLVKLPVAFNIAMGALLILSQPHYLILYKANCKTHFRGFLG